MVEPMFIAKLSQSVVKGQIVELTGPEAKHAVSVRRMRVGEPIQLTDTLGLRVRGNVHGISGNTLQVEVESAEADSVPDLKFTLVQALAKGDRDELAIQAATELGISSVIPWESDRSVSRWIGIKETKGVERWKLIVAEAAKQSLSARFPSVATPIKGVDISKIVADFDLVLVLDPTAGTGLGSVSIPDSGSVALVVGPEGGISEGELDALEQAGAKRGNLGSPILRTSTAGVAALSAILALTGQWGSK